MLDTTSKRDQPSYIAFDPSGNYLAVGLANGVLLMLEPKTFGDIPLGDFRNSLGGISKICFSRDGAFMATADEDRCVALYAYTSDRELVATEGGGIGLEESTCRQLAQDLSGGWIYVGKSRSHRAKITGLDFGMSIDGRPLLISVGEDRCVIEYDLEESSVVKGLVRKSEISVKVEQTAMPTTCMWYPIFPGAKEDVFVTANLTIS